MDDMKGFDQLLDDPLAMGDNAENEEADLLTIAAPHLDVSGVEASEWIDVYDALLAL